MADEIRKLEIEVERRLADLSRQLSVELPADVVARLRSSIRCELDERWLAGQCEPMPDGAVLDRVRHAVRKELARTHRNRSGWYRSGLVAAAILLCVGIARLVLRPSSPSTISSVSESLRGHVPNPVVLFVQASTRVWASDTLTPEILVGVEAVEDSLSNWRPARDDVEEMIEDLGQRMDELFDEPEAIGGIG